MKKLLFTMIFTLGFCFFSLAQAQMWVTANQGTVAWDPVPPLTVGDTIKYQVFTRSGTSGGGTPVGGEITATQQAITFVTEGRYFVGVKAIRYPVGETVGIPSVETSWSSDPLVCAAEGPFGFVYFVAPGGVKGLRSVP